MAANEYYSPPSYSSNYRPTPPSASPAPHPSRNPFASYDSTHSQGPSPYTSPTHEEPPYRHYDQTLSTTSTPYYANGGNGREQEHNPFADEIPLRPNPSKTDSGRTFHDHLPHDPAVLDAPPEGEISDQPRKRKRFFNRKIPWVVYTFTLIQCIVFIAELVKNGTLTGSPIEIHPSFNPMIGPSPYVLINMGARFVPCMRSTTQGLNASVPWPCPNTTTLEITDTAPACTLNQLCGFGDGPYSEDHLPHQGFRFIVPIFLHAGIVHIAFNMILQVLLGKEMELAIGSTRFFFVYISSGIFGFVLGGNFAPEGIASTGASGSLFGIIAIMLLDLLYHWEERRNPWSDLAWIVVDIVISFVLGLLPGLDNFSHIGGFLMGLVLGVCILHSPDVLRRRVGADLPPYATVKRSKKAAENEGFQAFIKEPTGFFKGRKALWWAWWLVRAAALIGVLAGFIALVQNFYKTNPTKCHWCQYLSCINYKNWCHIGQLDTTTTTGPSSRMMTMKRNIFEGPMPVLMDGLAF